MGQKVNPHGLRVGVIKNWDSRWFAERVQGKLFRKTTPKTDGTSAFHLEGKREIVYYKGYQKCNSGLAMP